MVDPKNANPNGEPPLGGNTCASHSSDIGISIPSTVVVSFTVQSRPRVSQSHPGTLIPTRASVYGSYIPRFTMPLYGGERIYGMSSSKMAGLHSNVLTFVENTTSSFSPYHKSRPMGSRFGRSTRMGFSS